MSNGTKTILYNEECWTSIETMPYWNWDKIISTGDLKYIFKECQGRVNYKIGEIWIGLQQQQLDEFGIDRTLLITNRIKAKIIKLNLQYIETSDESLLIHIDVAENNLKQYSNSESIKTYDLLNKITTHKGFDIDLKKFSVIKFFYALKDMAPKEHQNNG